jgi:hypothetical protein
LSWAKAIGREPRLTIIEAKADMPAKKDILPNGRAELVEKQNGIDLMAKHSG